MSPERTRARETLGRLQAALGEGEHVLVGGALRDEWLGRPHADWDLATSLRPETVMARVHAAGLKAFPTGLQHGTVTVIVDGAPFEITTFRSEEAYSDGRHPDRVHLGVSLLEDLARRDFTINAMALPIAALGAPGWREALVDPWGGRADLAQKVIRSVGDPLARFEEDGLRPLRACRFAAQLGFNLESATEAAIPKCLKIAGKVAVERAFAELTKLLRGAHASKGLRLMESTNLLDLWIPELRPMLGCVQNRYHRYDVWNHTLRALDFEETGHAAPRWALLLHDVAKPSARTQDDRGEAHFYGHEEHSVTMAQTILRRLKAGNQLIADVAALIRHHGVHPDKDWADPACRRFLLKLAEDRLELHVWTRFRLADQLAKGWGDPPQPGGRMDIGAWRENVAKECLATQARLQALLDARPPLTPKDLALDGKDIMALAGRPGGPWLGRLQRRLLEAVIENPDLNTPSGLKALSAQLLEGEL